jgi:hypothetical protein
MKVWKIECSGSYSGGIYIVAAKSAKRANKLVAKLEEYDQVSYGDNTITELSTLTHGNDAEVILASYYFIE